MKLSSITLPAAALTAASLVSSEIVHPEFTPFDKSSLAKDSFYEDFQDLDNWKVSHAKKDEEFTYVGKWELEEPFVLPGFKKDKGLVLKSPAAHHAISTRLPSLFNNTDNTLVLQYEVKLQKGLQCGGAYIKLLSAEGFPSNEGGDEFNNESPYQIMFGPDKCGSTNKVHFIIRRTDPVTGEVEEKHLKTPPLARTVKTTTLYTLIVKPNNDFEIRINGEVAKSGNLLSDGTFKPSFNPPTEIEDPSDIKPEDWDDREEIPDPNETSKPEDWDESAPRKIVDPNAVKPDDWLDNEEEFIPDPEAEIPEDWDEEEDGEWIAPEIPNPKCVEHGCGPWEAPLIDNPNFKGKWRQPIIPNPDYKGEWSPRLIPNPNYYEDINASNLEAIAGLGFELWTLQEDILFDNIYLGHSIDEAELIGNSTFVPKVVIEEEENAQNAPVADFEPETPPSFDQDESKISQVFDFALSKFNNFIEDGAEFYQDVKLAPIETITTRPFEALYFIGISLYTLVIATGIWGAIIYAFTGASSSAPAPAPKPTPDIKKSGENNEDETVTEVEIVEEIETTVNGTKTSSISITTDE